MIRHHTVREQWDRHAFECLYEDPLERSIVPLIEEQLVPANRPIVDVYDQVICGGERAAWHSHEFWSNINA